MGHLQKAFAFDIHIRRDVDEKAPANGIRVVSRFAGRRNGGDQGEAR